MDPIQYSIFPLIDLQSFDKQPKFDFCLSNAFQTKNYFAMIEISVYDPLEIYPIHNDMKSISMQRKHV